MTCGYCHKSFEENRSQKACKSCPLGSDCGLILCPHCGYENPGMPGWISFLRDRFGRKQKSPVPPPPSPVQRRRSLPILDASFGAEDHR